MSIVLLRLPVRGGDPLVVFRPPLDSSAGVGRRFLCGLGLVSWSCECNMLFMLCALRYRQRRASDAWCHARKKGSSCVMWYGSCGCGTGVCSTSDYGVQRYGFSFQDKHGLLI